MKIEVFSGRGKGKVKAASAVETAQIETDKSFAVYRAKINSSGATREILKQKNFGNIQASRSNEDNFKELKDCLPGSANGSSITPAAGSNLPPANTSDSLSTLLTG